MKGTEACWIRRKSCKFSSNRDTVGWRRKLEMCELTVSMFNLLWMSSALSATRPFHYIAQPAQRSKKKERIKWKSDVCGIRGYLIAIFLLQNGSFRFDYNQSFSGSFQLFFYQSLSENERKSFEKTFTNKNVSGYLNHRNFSKKHFTPKKQLSHWANNFM